MQIGTLRHFIDIYRLTNEKSATGAISKKKVKLTTLRAGILKQTGGFVEGSNENYDRVNIVFQTWLNKDILDTDTICWSNQEFRITLIEHDELSRTMKLHVTKIIK